MDRAVELTGLDEVTYDAIFYSVKKRTDVDVLARDSERGYYLLAGDLKSLLDELEHRAGNDDYRAEIITGSRDAYHILRSEVERLESKA